MECNRPLLYGAPYIDAFLATKGHVQLRDYDDRWGKMGVLPRRELSWMTFTSSIFHELYKESKQARYGAREYAPPDMPPIQARHDRVRSAMRQALGM